MIRIGAPRRHTVSIVIALGALLSSLPLPSQEPIRIRAGLVSGVRDGEVVSFKGIPYAAPPIGPLRWKPPQPVSSWQGVRQAAAFGPACPQRPAPGLAFAKDWSEDCLTINVWMPAARQSGSFPVYVIIPGGGFFMGGSADPRVDARPFVARGIVVVSFNYRLNVFGFLAHPALAKESPNGTSGNYGLMDEIAALRWVKENIGAFGGDPLNVTIAGNSAGGSSVLYLMVSPQARGLFARGISQSAGLVYGPIAHRTEPRYGMEAREVSGARLGELATLRALPAAELLERAAVRTIGMVSNGGNDYWPFVDGDLLPDEPWKLFDAGRFARVPLIIGTANDEATGFTIGLPIKTPDAWRSHLRGRSPGVEAEIESIYPAATDADIRPAVNRWINDWYFHGTARAIARAVSAANVPVFLYGFSRVPPIHPVLRENMGAFHTSEMEYLSGVPLRDSLGDSMFDVPLNRFPHLYDASDRVLSQAMIDLWVRFVATGDPSGSGLPAWPRYRQSSDQHLEFGTELRTGTQLYAPALDAFDRLFATMRAVLR